MFPVQNHSGDFCVYVVESNRVDEDGCCEGEALKQVLMFSHVEVVSTMVTDRAEFARALADSVRCRVRPVIHIATHGNENGIALRSGDFVTWDDLREILRPIYDYLKGEFVLSMSSCKGINALRVILQGMPIIGVLGSVEEVDWSDNVMAFAVFYHLSQKGCGYQHAVEAMRMASGHSSYVFC